MSALALKSQKASVLTNTCQDFIIMEPTEWVIKISDQQMVPEFNDRSAAFGSDFCKRTEICSN